MKRENRLIPAVIIISIIFMFLFRHRAQNKLPWGSICIILAVTAGYNGFLYWRGKSREDRRFSMICSGMALAMAGVVLAVCRLPGGSQGEIFLAGEGLLMFLAVCAWGIFCVRREKGNTENLISFLIFGGFLLRIYYAVIVQANLYQNDLGWLEPDNCGHLGYVYYLFSHGRLPDDDPMQAYQFYHPPLHHAVSAVFVKIHTVIGYSMNEIAEMLQLLPVMYTSLTLIFLNKIGIRLRIPAFGRAVGLGLASFMPFGVMMGAGLNNDALMVLFATMAVYFTLVWYEDPNFKSVLAMAVCIGCSMMSKMSGVLAAPAMAVLMLHKAWTERKHWTEYLKQFLVFGLAAFPLGLWYPALQYVRFKMPLGFVPMLPRESEQYVGMCGIWKRLFDFRDSFRALAVSWDNSSGADYNIPITMVKFAVFGETNYYRNNPATYAAGTGSFWMTFVLMILVVFSCFVWLFQKRNTIAEKASVSAVLIVHMLSYVMFCMKYPFVCTMNIRYVMAAVNFGFLVLGAASAGVREKTAAGKAQAGRVFKAVLSGIVGVYIAICTVLILQMGQLIQ